MIIVTIGHQNILLPESVNAARLIQDLSKGQPCFDWHDRVELREESLTLEMKIVPKGTKFVRKVGEVEEPVDVIIPVPNRLRLKAGGAK